MESFFFLAVFSCVFILVSCDVASINSSSLETETFTENTEIVTASDLGNSSESKENSMLEVFRRISGVSEKNSQNVSVLDIYHLISEGSEKNIDLSETEEDDDFSWLSELTIHDDHESRENSTEFLGVDANGCDRRLRKHLEDRCDNEYEKISDEAQDIEDHGQKTEALCCALEDFEKCTLRSLDKANCGSDKATIRENMKAARLFLTVISNVTCSRFRGQCAYYSSAVPVYASYIVGLGSLLITLARILI